MKGFWLVDIEERGHSKEWEPFVRRHRRRKDVVGNILSARWMQSLNGEHDQMLRLEKLVRIRLQREFNAIARNWSFVSMWSHQRTLK